MTTGQTNIQSVAGQTLRQTSWDGAAFDAGLYETVTVWCYAAPTTPYTITTGNGAQMASTFAVANLPGGVSSTSTIAGVGRYDVPGNCSIALSGGSGGAFGISGAQ